MSSITQQIATELAVGSQQIQAAIALLDDGATVPLLPVIVKRLPVA